MKTIIKSALLLLALLLPALANAHDFEVDGIFYNIINSNEVEVTYQESSWSYNTDRYSGEMTIPSSVYCNGKTYPVTTIGKYAFRSCSGLTSITIPNSVTTIGNSAFNRCTQLSSIQMPNSVTNIGYYAFDNTAWYNSQSEGPVYIGLVFYRYKGTMPDGTSITIKDGTLGIAGDAFEGCSGLTSINIPNSVTTISAYAFEGCSGLTTINNSNSIITIGNYAFYGCSSLTSIDFMNSVTTIGAYAFYGCTSLTSIDFMNSVTTIGDYAFYECYGLTSVTIPSSVTSIGKYPFCLCTALTNIQVTNDNPKFDSRDHCNAIIETATNTLIAGCKSTVIPNSVAAIGDNAFVGCSGLASISIPSSVTSIGNGAFASCTGLTSLTIPNSVAAISERAFSGCTGLTSIIVASDNPNYDSRNNCNAIIETTTNKLISGCNYTIIPNSVTTIGAYAFYYCTGLPSVTIPQSVTAIGDFAFGYCDGLNDVYCRIIYPSGISMGTSVFVRSSGEHPTRTLHVVSNEWEYQNDNRWSYYFDKIVTYDYEVDGIYYDIIGSEAIVTNGDNRYTGDVSIPPTVTIDGTEYTVTTIGESAFNGCTGLTSVVIPNSVTSIEEEAFRGCSGLANVTIPNSVTTIGAYAFDECDSLTSVEFPNSVSAIGSNAFDGTPWYNNQPNGLVYAGLVAYKYKGTMPEGTSITFREGTLGVAGGAFRGCSGLKSVEIPNSVTNLGRLSFAATGLTSVVIPGSVKTIGNKAFHSCEKLTNVTLSEGLTLIDEEAFDETGITEIHLPESLVRIGEQAFEETPLTSVTIPKNVAYLDNEGEYDNDLYGGVFDDCQQLLEVNVDPANATYASYNGMLLTKDLKTFLYYPGGRTGECVIPNTVTTIGGGQHAFDCPGLTSVIIPSKVEYIADEPFYDCDALTLVRIFAVTPPSVGDFDYYYSYSNITLEVPAESLEAYRAHEYWGQFQNIQPIVQTSGDVNGDGKISIADVTELIDYLLTDINVANADVNNDGKVSIADVTDLIDLLLTSGK